MVRGKFSVVEITSLSWSATAKRIKLQASYDTSIPEDQMYAKATPSGSIEMTIDNPPALAQLELGKAYYVDFTPAP